MNLSGKVALITGAARGLGKAFTESLLSKGAKVCMTDVLVQDGLETETSLQEKFGKEQSFFRKCDVTSPEEFDSVFKDVKDRFGRLDIVVNNAGIVNEKHWRKMMDVNLVAMMHGTLLGIDHMSRDKGGEGGVIINVASLAGLRPVFFTPAYCASKHGIIAYTRSWALNPENGKNGLRFCCLCPAFTDTAMTTIDKNTTLSMESALKFTELVGVNDVSTVADGFMKLVVDQSNNGAVMTVSVREGIQYIFQQDASGNK